jgi:tetratricopeptide (TPR) repeat protein
LEEAVSCYDRALEINPRDAVVWLNKGAMLSDLGRADKAIACFDRALKINPRDEAAWYNKGTLFEHLGQLEEALSCYDRALELIAIGCDLIATMRKPAHTIGAGDEFECRH